MKLKRQVSNELLFGFRQYSSCISTSKTVHEVHIGSIHLINRFFWFHCYHCSAVKDNVRRKWIQYWFLSCDIMMAAQQESARKKKQWRHVIVKQWYSGK
jgi:hypothetical protein